MPYRFRYLIDRLGAHGGAIRIRDWPRLIGVVLMIGLLASSVSASDRERHRHDHDQALAALTRGEILPFDKVLSAVKDTVKGEIIGVKLKRRQNVWIYEIKMILPGGGIVETAVDAKTAALIANSKD